MRIFMFTSMLLFLCFSCFMTGYTYHRDYVKDDLQNVLDWNTKQIHSVGVAARIQSHNSDLLIQILNHLDGRPIKAVTRELLVDDFDGPIENDDIEPTPEQIEQDQREVDQSIRALSSGGLFQGETLYTILDKLENPEIETF